MAKKEVRWKNAVGLLTEKGELSVREMAQALQVSEVTVRRDLMEMEASRIVQRVHGGARLFDSTSLLGEPYVIGEQTIRNKREKTLIGLKAASMVSAGDTIFLDSGSTTPFIAKYLDKELSITVLCYTFLNALELYTHKETNLILAGGFYHRDSTIFHSSACSALIKGVRADKAFVAAAGVDARLGLTTYFNFEVEIKRLLIESAKQVILVVDSSKFGKMSIFHFADLDQIHTVITDDGIRDEEARLLGERGIELIVAR